jgi:hypothetical protein
VISSSPPIQFNEFGNFRAEDEDSDELEVDDVAEAKISLEPSLLKRQKSLQSSSWPENKDFS